MFLLTITGALHEDGLADVFDAFRAGRSPERIHGILKDSRIGVFGALALLMTILPFLTMLDPGVTLAYAGEEKGPGSEPCDVIKLSFDSVGLTPKDVYWFYVDKATHLMPEWKYVLDGGKEPPTAVAWTEWQQAGPIRLAMAKPMMGKPVAIRFENVRVSEAVDEAALTPPPR